MLTIKTPATSANVGPGFDCLGLALTLYNQFEVELSDTDRLENVEDKYNNADNLFLQAFHTGCKAIGVDSHIHVIFHCNIPSSRGLGSSASLIVGGLLAASILHDDALSNAKLFQLASQMEGHPDNVAPCFFGGFTASTKVDQKFITHPLELHDSWQYYACIPNFEVSTEAARAILPNEYTRDIASLNGSHAILLTDALRTGNLPLLKISSEDYIHEPYRKTLIPEFNDLQQIIEGDTNGILLISGSGSTCLAIANRPLSAHAFKQINNLNNGWHIHHLKIAYKGTEILDHYE